MATQHYFVYVDSYGNTFWYKDQEHTLLHRLGGPAFTSSGMSSWYQNGQLHREDGPAIEFATGGEEWYQNGKLHRVDGAAINWANGTKSWYLNGKKITQEQHKRLTAPQVEEMTMAQLEAALGKKIKIIK